MRASIKSQTTLRTWILGTIAMLLSIGSAFSYFIHLGHGIIVGALLGLPGREADVAVAQHRYTYWLMLSLFCLASSIVTTSLALPFYADASRLSRFMARFVLASIFSIVLTVLIGLVSFSMIGTSSVRTSLIGTSC